MRSSARTPLAHRTVERVGKTAAPRLQIRIAQAREPGVARRQLVHAFEEAERLEERREGMRDRGVAPVEDAQPLGLDVEVRHVEVVVLNRVADAACGELAAELREPRRELAQQPELLPLER